MCCCAKCQIYGDVWSCHSRTVASTTVTEATVVRCIGLHGKHREAYISGRQLHFRTHNQITCRVSRPQRRKKHSENTFRSRNLRTFELRFSHFSLSLIELRKVYPKFIQQQLKAIFAKMHRNLVAVLVLFASTLVFADDLIR